MPRAFKKAPNSGLRRLMRGVQARGMQVIDRRSAAYRTVREWREVLLTALGGEENVSPQKITLVELATRMRLFLDHCDGFILSQKSLVNRRKKTIIPIVLQRQQLADSLQKTLITLGLERVPIPTPTLAEVLRRRETDETARSVSDRAEEHSS